MGGEREGRSKKEGWKWQELPNVYKPGFRLSGTPTGSACGRFSPALPWAVLRSLATAHGQGQGLATGGSG